jgi:hypothetical protein
MHPLETLSHNRDILRQQLDPDNGYEDIFDEVDRLASALLSRLQQQAVVGQAMHLLASFVVSKTYKQDLQDQ